MTGRTITLATGLGEVLTDATGEALTDAAGAALTVGALSVHATEVAVADPNAVTATLSVLVGLLVDGNGDYLTDGNGRSLSALSVPVVHSTTLTVSDWG